MTIIHTWKEFEEWAKKHPETEVATVTVTSERLLEHAYIKAKNRVDGPQQVFMRDETRVDHYFTSHVLRPGFQYLTEDANRILNICKFGCVLQPNLEGNHYA